MYVLDEPSIGLHQRDNDRLIDTLKHLRDLGNSVLVVEHDEDMIRAADHVIDMGPGAGVHGGHVMAQGTYAEVAATPDSLTGQYLCGARARSHVPARRTPWLPVVQPSGVCTPAKAPRFRAQPGRRAPRRARSGAPGHAGRAAGNPRDRRQRQQPAERRAWRSRSAC